MIKISIFIGDITAAEADAVCTSTNPRLSLVMGTGAAVRSRGGYQILRECEALARQPLPAGTAWATTAGTLPHKVAIHCVASNAAHHSSEAIVRSCVAAALAVAGERGCRSVAMPVFGTGHAHLDFRTAVNAMAEALGDARTSVEQIVIAVLNEEQATIVQERFPEAAVAVDEDALAPVSSWLSDEDDSRW